MLAIKFRRVGRRHQPSYRIVVAEKRSKLAGRYVEDLGWYNSFSKLSRFNKERIDYWLSVGAQPTDSVHNLLVRGKIVVGSMVAVHKKKRGVVTEKKNQSQKVGVSAPVPQESTAEANPASLN